MLSLRKKNKYLVSKTVIIELKHYALCFQNGVLMWKFVMEKLNGYNFFIEDDELLETYNGIWDKVGNSIKKEIDCEPITRKKFWKPK